MGMLSARELLEKGLKQAKDPVVVFDLDGTLFDVGFRTLTILNRFCTQTEIIERFPKLVEQVQRLTHPEVLYNVEGTLNAQGIDRYSEHSAHFLHLAETYWFKHFFTDEMVLEDRPYAGALECVRWVHDQGAHVVYLSGRDIPNMSKGTIESLEKFGFPHRGHRVSICLKQRYGLDDLEFKANAMGEIAKTGTVVATFDNEPANVNLFLKDFPDALHVHFHTLFARHVELKGKNLRVVKSFTEMGF